MFDSHVEYPVIVDAWSDQEKKKRKHPCTTIQGDMGDRNL